MTAIEPTSRRAAIKKRTVFRDNAIEQICPWENPQKVIELPAGDENQPSSGCANSLKRGKRRRIDAPIQCERAVVVRRERDVAHPLYGEGNISLLVIMRPTPHI